MSADTIDPSKKRFLVFISEIKQQFVWAEQFSGQYTKSVTPSDGTTRTVELTAVKRDGRDAIEFNDTGHRQYMDLIPVRNNGHINGNLMVRILDMDDMDAARGEWRSRQPASPVLPPDTSLISVPESVPPGFTQGIEIFNDDATPMKFVADVLTTHAGLSPEEANRTMLAIHKRGGALVPTTSLDDARRIAAQIAVEAAKQSYPLTCRPVSIRS